MPRRLVLVAALASAAGCEDFATPAELTKTTVLAVIADPPIVPPGASARLTAVVAGPDGPVEAPTVTWALGETYPGVPAFGTVTAGAAGEATYTAPDPVPALPDKIPPVVTVQATVGAEPPVTALKAIGVLDVPAANPAIDAITLDGTAATDAATVARNATVALGVTVTPAPDDQTTYAWYATIGEIERYQSSPTTLVAPADAGSGWLFAVVRDGKGGTAVEAIQLTVE